MLYAQKFELYFLLQRAANTTSNMKIIYFVILASHATSLAYGKCEDKPNFQFGKNDEKSCAWLAKEETTKLDKYCLKNRIKKKCEKTCGTCENDCTNVAKFKFKVDGSNDKKGCGWLEGETVRQGKYCVKRNIKKSCEKACEACGNDQCVNNANFLFADEDETERTCKWLGRKTDRRDTYCDKPKIKKECKKACKVCGNDGCKDDKQFEFLASKEKGMKTCAWLVGQSVRSRKHCKNSDVNKHCCLSCSEFGE